MQARVCAFLEGGGVATLLSQVKNLLGGREGAWILGIPLSWDSIGPTDAAYTSLVFLEAGAVMNYYMPYLHYQMVEV